MKIKTLLIILTLIYPSVIIASSADVGQHIDNRKDIVMRSNDCVKKVRKMEMKRDPDKFPTFDAYVSSWGAKLFSKDNDLVTIPRYKLKGEEQDKQAYLKCMEESE